MFMKICQKGDPVVSHRGKKLYKQTTTFLITI